MTVSDNTVAAESLGEVWNFLVKKGLIVSKKVKNLF